MHFALPLSRNLLDLLLFLPLIHLIKSHQVFNPHVLLLPLLCLVIWIPRGLLSDLLLLLSPAISCLLVVWNTLLLLSVILRPLAQVLLKVPSTLLPSLLKGRSSGCLSLSFLFLSLSLLLLSPSHLFLPRRLLPPPSSS